MTHSAWFWFFLVIGAVFGCFLLSCAIFYVSFYRKGHRRIKGEHRRPKKIPFYKSFFVLLPRRLIADYFAHDPDEFSHQGCIIFTGRQGYGKTIAMAEQVIKWRYEFPRCKTITNFGFISEDDVLSHWRQLIDYTNGIYGVICCIDETQNWFSSNQSKDFPPEMLEVVTQNRKNRRVILGTAQSFNRLSKPLREQATEVRKCFTFFHALTVVLRQIPELDAMGNVVKWKPKGWYYFVHTKEIRESYDTYRVIKSLADAGFQPRQAITENTPVPFPVVSTGRKKVRS